MGALTSRHGNVYVYVPNLIGYARILFALYAFGVAFHSPVQCVICYLISFVCDELDGRFARMCNQTSTLGAVLDMVTDRLSTTCLLLVLSMLYPRYHLVCIALIMLDIFSHWFQMYSTLLVGSASHKDVSSRSWLVRIYYKHRLFMGFCCIACEVLYLVLYLFHWPQFLETRVAALNSGLLPPALVHRLPVVLHHVVSPKGVPVLVLVGLATLPGVLTKQICNMVQLVNAADTLVQYDQDRDAQAQQKKRDA